MRAPVSTILAPILSTIGVRGDGRAPGFELAGGREFSLWFGVEDVETRGRDVDPDAAGGLDPDPLCEVSDEQSFGLSCGPGPIFSTPGGEV